MHAFAQTKEALERGDLGDPMYCYARLNNTLYVPTKMLSWSAATQLPFWLIDLLPSAHLVLAPKKACHLISTSAGNG